MKTFKDIVFKPCKDIEGIRGQIEINGQVVSVISGMWTRGTWTTSPLVHKHDLFEVAVWPVGQPDLWNTKKWHRKAQGIQCPVVGDLNRRAINRLMKKIQAS